MNDIYIIHPLPVCFLLGVFGGIIRYLDLILKDRKNCKLAYSELIMRALISGFCSLVASLILADFEEISLNLRYSLSAIAGYGGTYTLNTLVDSYLKRIGSILRFAINQSIDETKTKKEENGDG